MAPGEVGRRVTIPVEFISREEFARRVASPSGKTATLMRQLETLLPYVTVNRLFDSRTADALLEGSGILFPFFREYADRVFDYCIRTHWGRTSR